MYIRQAVLFPALLTFVLAVNAEDKGYMSGFQNIDLDKLLHEAPTMNQVKGGVKILPDKIHFLAKILSMPEPRLGKYLVKTMQLNGAKKIPNVKQGMRLLSMKDKAVHVYLSEHAVIRVNHFKKGDQAKFYGYHMYSTAYGPGILVTDIKSE